MLRNLVYTTTRKSNYIRVGCTSIRYLSTKRKVLTVETMHPLVKNAEYAVRGALPIRAEALKEQLKKDPSKLNFDKVVFCNIGNPQQLNQKPITFFRQVSSLCENGELLKTENRAVVSKLYPADAIARAEVLLKHIGSVGAYSHSKGITHIRENVARFIERRDGFAADPDNIYLTQGASEGVQKIIHLLTECPNSGIMIPIPQYPLYSATIALVNATPVPYYLNEREDWGLDTKGLKKSVQEARQNGTDVRALVIINPGNPTGQCLSEENIRDIIRFAHEERIVLLADEVYQTNIYQPERRPFHSFKKVLTSMGPEYQDQELFSFHSTSKGVVGECGRRGGYFECLNIDSEVMEQIYKIQSISLCPNVQGQIMVDLMTNPPVKGDESYPQYKAEIDAIHQSLGRRAKRLAVCFNGLENVTCNNAEGAMYLFPRINLPPKAIEAAEHAKMAPDAFYSMAMLETTGVCVVPGTGFGQEPNTWHFRSTFLPEEQLFDEFCAKLEKFHSQFMDKYRD